MRKLWIRLIFSGIVCIALGIALILTDYNVAVSIGTSIIAAFIFYIPMNFVPERIAYKKERPILMMMYRRLQYLLASLDDMILEAYKIAGKSVDINGVSVEYVYDPQRIRKSLRTLNTNSETSVMDYLMTKHWSFNELYYDKWKKVESFGREISQMSLPLEYNVLSSEIFHLLYESFLSVYFRDNLYVSITISLDCLWVQIKEDDSLDSKTCDAIIKLHHLAFTYYDEIMREVPEIVRYKPYFYEAEGRQDN